MEKYQITKTIRFKLEPKEIKQIQTSMEFAKGSSRFNLITFVSDLNNFIGRIKHYLFFQRKDKSVTIKEKLIIKNDWLRTYAKQEFAEFKSKQQQDNRNNTRRVQTSIGDISLLFAKIKNAVDKVYIIYTELANDAAATLNERAKRAQTALLLKQLSAKKVLPFLTSLVENSTDKNETDDLSIQLKRAGENLNKQLLVGIQEYMPEQSNGLPIAKASFNYYTINKNAIDFNSKINDLTRKLKIDFNSGIKTYCKNNRLNPRQDFSNNFYSALNQEIETVISDKILFIGDAPMQNESEYKSLRQILKNIKSRQKSAFTEFIQKNGSYEELKNRKELYLFNDVCQVDFDAFKQKTDEIEQKSTEQNKCPNEDRKKQLQSESQELKRKRGSLINAADKKNNDKFKAYKSFAELYRNVSQKHGRILAQLMGIEKEQIESQLLNYWAIILEMDNRHKLILIPKEKAANCKKWLETNKNHSENSKVYWFESFTFRSLRKLCFGNLDNGTESNTFYPEIKKELYEKYLFEDKNRKKHFIKGEFEFDGDEQKKIQFYKDVLNTIYAKSVLKLPIQDVESQIIEQDFESLDTFKIALEKICYVRFVVFDTAFLKTLNGFDAQIFDMTSLDLQNPESVKNKEVVFAHKDKSLTKMWRQFWTEENENNNFAIRLNPEITITYRNPKKSRINKYGEKSTLYDPNKKNRYLHDQFTLCTTFTENALTPEINFAFKDVKTKGNAIIDFNNEINHLANNSYCFGIDAGEVEFATLAIVKKEDNKIIPQEFTVYIIKDLGFSKKGYLYNNGEPILRENPYKVIDNVSYFLNKELYHKTFRDEKFDETFDTIFKTEKVSAIDLTTAKVISGKIITNGDIISLLNAKLLHAKRRIYQTLIKEPNAKITKDGFKLYFSDTNGFEKEKLIYISREDFEYKKKFKEIVDELNDFAANMKISDLALEEKVHHIRRAIAGNMVGVIHHLYQKYSGYIAIEDLKQEKVESDRLKNEANIERPLEWALYRKFQTEGLTPPISELIQLREKEKFEALIGKQKRYKPIQQFGIIKFVSESETSTTCPSCGKKAYINSKDKKYNEDKQKKVFECAECKFHNKNNSLEFHSLDTNDKVAAFNIAKRGL